MRERAQTHLGHSCTKGRKDYPAQPTLARHQLSLRSAARVQRGPQPSTYRSPTECFLLRNCVGEADKRSIWWRDGSRKHRSDFPMKAAWHNCHTWLGFRQGWDHLLPRAATDHREEEELLPKPYFLRSGVVPGAPGHVSKTRIKSRPAKFDGNLHPEVIAGEIGRASCRERV